MSTSKVDSTKWTALQENIGGGIVANPTAIEEALDNMRTVVDQHAGVIDANSSEGQYAADAGSTDSYAITLSPAPSAYFTGMVVRFKANTANNGAATLNVNSLGARTIKIEFNSDLVTGDILAGQNVEVIYDGTNFQMLSPSSNRVKRSGDTMTGLLTASANIEIGNAGSATSKPTKYASVSSNALTDTVGFQMYVGDGVQQTRAQFYLNAQTKEIIFNHAYASAGNCDYVFSVISTELFRILKTGGIQIGTATKIYTGTGTPEGVVTAPVGSLFLRTDGGASTTFYVKQSSSGNTGWGAK